MKEIQSVYLIGIGGSGMEPLAYFARQKGMKVAGSDHSLKPEQKKILEQADISAYQEPLPERLENFDAIVYSSAVGADHPEKKAALEQMNSLSGKTSSFSSQKAIFHRMDFLNFCMRGCEHQFAIAGTHGKTSTSSMMSWLLLGCKLEPHIIIGGRPLFLRYKSKQTIGSYFGKGNLGVYETDESDGSFLKSEAENRLILNIDRDHLDNYGCFDSLQKAFSKFCFHENSRLLVLHSNLFELSEFFKIFSKKISAEKKIFVFSTEEKSHKIKPYCRGEFTVDKHGEISMKVFYREQPLKRELRLKMPGRHFCENALGVLTLFLAARDNNVFSSYGDLPPIDDMIDILNNFPGVQRRMEIVGRFNGAPIYDDYGHHPVEMEAVLKALQTQLPKKGNLLVIFQPHRYSRTEQFYSDFAKALCLANRVFLLPIYPAGEQEKVGINSELILKEIHSISPNTSAQLLCENDLSSVLTSLKPNDIGIGMGAGSISRLLRSSIKNMPCLEKQF